MIGTRPCGYASLVLKSFIGKIAIEQIHITASAFVYLYIQTIFIKQVKLIVHTILSRISGN